MNPNPKQILMALGAFLAAWQIGDFALDYRSILGAVTTAILAGMNPKAANRGGE